MWWIIIPPGRRNQSLPFETKAKINPISKPQVHILYSALKPMFNAPILCADSLTMNVSDTKRVALKKFRSPTPTFTSDPVPHSLKDMINAIINMEIIIPFSSEGLNL